jgi:uncharacterized protein YgiM (DUF1202 family)
MHSRPARNRRREFLSAGRRAMAAALAAIALAACESVQRVEAPATGATTSSAATAPPAAPAPTTAGEAPAAQPDPSAVRAPEPVNPAVTAAAPPARRILYIKTAFANLRAGPATAAKALGVLKKGTRLEEHETRSQWHRVKLEDGREGWVAQSVASETPP